MSNAILQGGASGSGSMTLLAPNTVSTQILTLPDVTGTVLAGVASASTTNTVTNKISINIGGTVYYVLASTSSA